MDKALKLKNRIALLTHRDKENGRIVKKLERQLRNLELAAAVPEVQ